MIQQVKIKLSKWVNNQIQQKSLEAVPAGSTVAYKEPVDTKTPGEKNAIVVVTYPDKSTDEVP